MLLLLLSLFSHYELLNCDEGENVKFNESLLVSQHHQHFLEVNAFLEDVRHKINEEGSMLKAGDYEHETIRDDEVMDYSTTNLWWNSTPRIDQTDQSSPQTSFLPLDHKFPDKVDTTRRFSPYSLLYPPTLDPESGSHHPGPPGYPPFPGYPLADTYIEKPSLRPNSKYVSPYPSPFHYKPEVSPLGSSFITRLSFPFSIAPYTTEVDIRHKLDEFFTGQYPPDHPLYVPTTFNRQVLLTSKRPPGKEYTYQRYFTKAFESRPYISSEKFKRRGFPFSKIHSSPVIFRRGSDSSQGPIHTRPTTTLMIQNSKNMKIWLREVTKYTPVEKWMKTLTMQTGVTSSYHYTSLPNSLQQITNIPPSTKRDIQISHTLSKPQEWVRKRQTKNGFKNPTRPVYRQGISLHDRPTEFRDYGFPRATAKKDNIFLEDERGFLQVGATAEDKNTGTTMVDGRSANYAEMNWMTPTTAGVVLKAMKVSKAFRKPVNKPYHDMMYKFHEGYMMVFMLELARLISTKNKEDVQDVIIHTEKIINDLFQTAQLTWFGQPLIDATMKLSILLTEAETDIVQAYASMLHQMLQERKITMAVDVNAIINYADSLYEDTEGELLFDTIKEFEEYPNITKTSRQLCYSLIENFLKPFRRLQHSEKRQALLDSVNHALEKRFHQRRFSEESLPLSGEEQEILGSQAESSSETLRFRSRDRKIRRNHQSVRKNRTRQRYQNHRYKHTEDSNKNMHRKQNSQYDKFPKLRRMMRIINSVKRTSTNTPKNGIHEINVQTKDELYLNLLTPPTKEYVFNEKQKEKTYQRNQLKFFDFQHYTTEGERHYKYNFNEGTEDKRRIKHIDDGRDEAEEDGTKKAALRDKKEFYQQIKKRLKESEAFKKAQKKKLKDELLRKIVEGSSYSDEEASLKMNLIEALHHENKTFMDNDVVTTTDPPASHRPRRIK